MMSDIPYPGAEVRGATARRRTHSDYISSSGCLRDLILDNIALGGHVDAIQELTDVLVLHRTDLLDERAAARKGTGLS